MLEKKNVIAFEKNRCFLFKVNVGTSDIVTSDELFDRNPQNLRK